MAEPSNLRRYAAQARSSETFGRVLCSARDQHFISDGPPANGCPGEATSPAELFLSGVAACGVELVQVLAKDAGLPLRGVRVNIEGVQDRDRPVRPDVSLFNSVRLQFELSGLSDEQAKELIERFRRR